MKKQLIIASMLCAAACFAQNADPAAPAAAEPAGDSILTQQVMVYS